MALSHRRVLLAKPRSSCAGVERAVRTVEICLEKYGPPIYVRKQIVHNTFVVKSLEERGVIFVEETEEVPEGATVVFSAHGVAPSVHEEARAQNLTTIDATCPLVTKVHREAVRFAEADYDILLIGHDGHEEVIGTLGEAPDHIHLVDGPDDVKNVQVRDPDRVVWLSQTTLSVDETLATVAALRRRFPNLMDPPSDDICYATQNRQVAVKEIAAASELVIVVGSANSSNSVRLVEVARECGTAAHLVDCAEEIDESWLDGVTTVGLTSGASVPDELVQDVLTWLRERGYDEVQEIEPVTEGMHFALPRELDHPGTAQSASRARTSAAATERPGEGPPRTLLEGIRDPADLRELPAEELPALAAEIRDFLVGAVARTGGHLGPNLGVVELMIALHRVFASPDDKFIFDTGHQSYVHKLLTGRADGFDRLRQRGGLSGYPSQAESVHDLVENSHASTALSYADGLAKAYQRRGLADRSVVAVIGDGALTGGMAWEGLNNLAGAPDRPVIVVLNDNGRSYAPTIGGIGRHLQHLRNSSDSWLEVYTRDGRAAEDNLFTTMGFGYIGPVNGHDVSACERALEAARAMGRPVVVHVVTRKGRGYAPAENDQADHMHGIGKIDPETGKAPASSGTSWTKIFADELCAVGEDHDEVVAITAAMPGPTGLSAFAERFPDRMYDVGIAEQHAAGSAAGLALGGLHPVVAVYSTFLNRAFDQVVMDVALHRLPVTFVLDRAGITGPDGASHNGMWDMSILGVVPGVRVAAPRDPARLRETLREAVEVSDGPTVLRFPKATAGPDIDAVVRVDGMDLLRRSRGLSLDVLIVSTGVLAEACLQAADILEDQGIGVTIIDPRWVIPVNPALTGLAARHQLVVTVEDSSRTGGVGACLAQACADEGVRTPVRNLGLPRAFIEHGDRTGLLADMGLSGEEIARTVRDYHADLRVSARTGAETSPR